MAMKEVERVVVLKNEKTCKWEVRTRYRDFTGEKKQKTKRGFALKRGGGLGKGLPLEASR